MVVESGKEVNCDRPATHYATGKVCEHSVFIPMCTDHADQAVPSLDVVRAITEARGPR
jgi:hypothetical protein